MGVFQINIEYIEWEKGTDEKDESLENLNITFNTHVFYVQINLNESEHLTALWQVAVESNSAVEVLKKKMK